MKDIMGLMKQAKAMQEKMQDLQNEIAGAEATGRSGGGLVAVTLNGRNEMTTLKIDPSLIKGDEAEILEDLILAAHNDARARIEATVAEKTQALTAGMPLPAGMKFPF